MFIDIIFYLIIKFDCFYMFNNHYLIIVDLILNFLLIMVVLLLMCKYFLIIIFIAFFVRYFVGFVALYYLYLIFDNFKYFLKSKVVEFLFISLFINFIENLDYFIYF